MKSPDKARGANVRRNLKRWRRPLLFGLAGWLFCALGIGMGAIIYARDNHLSQRRIEALGEGVGAIMSIVLVVAGLAVLVMADRKKAP